MEIALKGKHGNGKFAIVSAEDFEQLKHTPIHMLRSGYLLIYDKQSKKQMYLHRYVMRDELTQNSQQLVVDHVNRCKNDCRKENLRITTQQDNLCNRSKTSFKTSSIYKGVCKTVTGKWIAYITKNKQKFYLGTFDDEKLAALVYNLHAMDKHKAFAMLNTIN